MQNSPKKVVDQYVLRGCIKDVTTRMEEIQQERDELSIRMSRLNFRLYELTAKKIDLLHQLEG